MKKLILLIVFIVTLIPQSSHAQTIYRTLDIPKLGYQYPIPIVEIPFKNSQWDVAGLKDYIGWLEDTQWIDGNTVLASDVLYRPFGELEEKIALGDLIILYDGENIYNYYVTEIYKVDPTDISPTAWTNERVLTLMTCSDNETKRFIVKARP